MALLHSRVKLVVFLVPMPLTGGCGGGDGAGTCVPRLKGVNHRFGIGRWKGLGEAGEGRRGIDGEEGEGDGKEEDGREDIREELVMLRQEVGDDIDA
jgi:hypothetical protein